MTPVKKRKALDKKKRTKVVPVADLAGPYAKSDTATLPLEKRVGGAIKQRRLAANLTLAALSEGPECRAPC